MTSLLCRLAPPILLSVSIFSMRIILFMRYHHTFDDDNDDLHFILFVALSAILHAKLHNCFYFFFFSRALSIWTARTIYTFLLLECILYIIWIAAEVLVWLPRHTWTMDGHPKGTNKWVHWYVRVSVRVPPVEGVNSSEPLLCISSQRVT